MKKWGEYSYDVQFILQRSPLDPHKAGGVKAGGATTPNHLSAAAGGGGDGIGGIWKSPPGGRTKHHPDSARLSPDSG